MFKALKRHFIPNEDNGYRPHFLHAGSIKRVALALLVAELLLFVLPTFNFYRYANGLNISAVLPGVLSNLTNEERVKSNLPKLAVNPLLTTAAELKARDMAAKGYFAHTSPDGKAPWHWFKEAGYSFEYAGENLAVNFTDTEKVAQAWMSSPTHRANIIKGAYTEVGTGIATGTYKGGDTVFVAQVYGRPKIKSQLVSAAGASEWQELLATPRHTADVAFALALAVIIASLLLNVFVRYEYQYPDLMRNGLFVILMIVGVHLANGYVASRDFETSFIAFDSTQAAE
jgi:hypothetical protein